MWFSNIHARAFGPMKNQSLKFEKGLNILHGPNESGKSSWHAAIAAALCGLRRGAGRTKEESEFEAHHRPWRAADGDPWCVATEIVLDDSRRIQIDRDFENGRTEARRAGLASREFTELEMTEGSPDAARLLGLDRKTFPMTASVRQARIISDLDDPDALQQHLARAAAGGAGDTAAEALKGIETYKKEHVGTTRANSVKPLHRAMKAVEDGKCNLDTVKRAHRTYQELASSLDTRRREVERLTSEKAVAEAQRRYCTAAQEADRLEAAVKKIDQWEKRFVAGDPSRSELPELTELAEALGGVKNLPEPQTTSLESVEDLEHRISALEPEESQPCPSVEEVRACVTALRDTSAPFERVPSRVVAWKWAVVVGLVGAVISGLAAGPALGGLQAVVAAVVAGVVAAAAARWVATRRPHASPAGAKRRASVVEHSQVLSQLDEWQLPHDAVEALTEHSSRIRTRNELSSLRARLNERRNFDAEEAQREDSRQGAWRQLRAVAGAHGVTGTDDEVRASVDELLNRHDEIREQRDTDVREWGRYQQALEGRTPRDWRDEARDAKSAIDEAQQRLENLGAEPDRRLSEFGELDGKVRSVDDKLRQAQNAQATARGALSRVDPASVDVAAAEARLSEAEVELVRVERLAATLDTTRAFLEKAAENAHLLIAPRLATGMSPWIPKVTNGRYQRVEVDPGNLDVTLITPSGDRCNARLVSRGTTEQVYLVLRLVLAQVLSADHEACPVLLDDPTVHADAARKTEILDYLLAASKEHQVIVFSQEQEVLDWAKQQPSGAVHLIELPEPQPA